MAAPVEDAPPQEEAVNSSEASVASGKEEVDDASSGQEEVDDVKTYVLFYRGVDTFAARELLARVAASPELIAPPPAEDDEDDEEDAEEEEQGAADSTPEPFKWKVVGTRLDGSTEAVPGCDVVLADSDHAAVHNAVLEAATVIWDVTNGDTESGKAVLELLEGEGVGEKVFVTLSNVLSWARTQAEDGEVTEEDYRRRKAHPKFKRQIFFEKLTLRMKAPIRPFVCATGLLYGAGENPLHYLFRRAYEGKGLPIVASGNNVVPTVHVRDAAKILWSVALGKSPSRYVLAVDPSNVTQADIIRTLSSELGNGLAVNLTRQQGLLDITEEDANPKTLDLLSDIDLPTMPSEFVTEVLGGDEESEGDGEGGTPGIVESIKEIIAEYKLARNLIPVRIFVHGPPASGKSTLATELAEHYEVHHWYTKKLLFIADYFLEHGEVPVEVPRLWLPNANGEVPKKATATADSEAPAAEDAPSEVVADENEDGEEEDADEEPEEVPRPEYLDELQEIAEAIRDAREEAAGDDEEEEGEESDVKSKKNKAEPRVPEELVNRLFRWAVNSWGSKNQGYVIDANFTMDAATELFAKDDEEEEEGSSDKGSKEAANRALLKSNLPEFAVVLEAKDDFLRNRMLRAPEAHIIPGHSDETGFERRLAAFREANTPDESVTNFFEEHEEILPIFIDIAEGAPETGREVQALTEEIEGICGPKRVYGPSAAQLAEMEERAAEERRKVEEREQQRISEESARVEAESAERHKEWQARVDKLKQEEQHVLDLQSVPHRTYLMDSVMPTIAAGLVELAKIRPDDPIDFLAEFLIRKASTQ